jgi:hypothetical protein
MISCRASLVELAAGALACLVLLAGCSAPAEPTRTPAYTPTVAPTPTVALQPAPASRLAMRLLYPRPDTEIETGQSVKFIVQVDNAQGRAIDDARVVLTIRDPNGQVIASIPAAPYSENTFRTDTWTVPHRTLGGAWNVDMEVKVGSAQGEATGSFRVKNSTGEVLLNKYGFWLDAPTLKGIVPQLGAERGDARNGMIRWGGVIPAQHVLPEAWVELNWREGEYPLETPDAARRFLLEQVGDLGVTAPVRSLGPIQPIRFKQWAAWQVEGQGQLAYNLVEWVVFYAPEVNKTYSIGTYVVSPPAGIDPHAKLRESFAVFPDIHAASIAPEPLPRLLPGPELVSPPLGARFQGLGQPIVLQWKPVKELAQDEYYEVGVDYNYVETNPMVRYTTRETRLTLPEELYRTPNCQVFNWQVKLKRQTGVDDSGQLKGEPISYNSLYWYLMWMRAVGVESPTKGCPNAQY